MSLDDFCITSGYTIIEAIDIIRSNKNRGAIVINNENKVLGFISQGDILEALVSGSSLYAPVDGIMKPSFLYSFEKDYEKVLPIFREKLITILPIVDQELKLVDIVTLKDILENHNFKVI